MSAAAPSVFFAAFMALFLGLTLGGLAAAFAGMALGEAGVKHGRRVLAVAAVFVAIVVTAIAIGAVLHHTAWIDYRRQQ